MQQVQGVLAIIEVQAIADPAGRQVEQMSRRRASCRPSAH
jgi:hypothetical protein